MGRVISFIEKNENLGPSNSPERNSKTRKKPLNPKLPIIRFLVVIIGVYLVFAFGGQFLKLNEMNQEVSKIKTQINQLEQSNREIQAEITRLKSNTYVERMAREKLGLVKPGETVILPAKTNVEKP